MKPVKLAATLMALVLTTGCWDRTELNELSITSATSVDRKDGQWVVSYQVVIPSSISGSMANVKGASSKLPVIVYSTSGPTIREAVFQSTFESPRKLFFSHNRVIVISDSVAKEGLESLVDVYFRNPDSRETVSVLIARDNARKIIEQLMQIQIIPGDGIYETMRTESQRYSALPQTNMFELAMQLTGSARSAVIPEILVSGETPVTTSKQMDSTSLSSKLRLGRLAVLREGKLSGWLSEEEALGVSFLRNKIERTVLSFPCRAADPTVTSSVQISRSNTRIVPSRRGDELSVTAKVKAQGALLETNCKVDLLEANVIRELEKQVRQRIVEVIESGFEATRKLRTDVVGFADAYHRKYPKLWHQIRGDWPAKYADIRLNVQVEFTLKRIGLTNKSFKKSFEQEEK